MVLKAYTACLFYNKSFWKLALSYPHAEKPSPYIDAGAEQETKVPMRGNVRIRKTTPCPRSVPSLVRGKRTLKVWGFSMGRQDRMETWRPQEQPSSTSRGQGGFPRRCVYTVLQELARGKAGWGCLFRP